MTTSFKGGPYWKVQPWVPSLDPLRGIAALAVVVHHSTQTWGLTNDFTAHSATMFLWLGTWGVALFFVLSGFCIHLPQARAFLRNSDHKVDWARFARRRVWRLLPTHYAALVLAAVIGSFLQTTFLIGVPSIASFTAHVFMVHVWFSRYFFTINAVFWTIAIEVHFYICYPVYLWLRKQLGSVVTTVVLLFVGLLAYEAATLLVHRGPQYYVFQRFFLVSWWQWALGAALADIYVRGKAGWWAKLLSFKFAPAVYLFLSFLVGVRDYAIREIHVGVWLLPLVCGALLGSLVIRQTGHVPFLSNAGVYSYSIYLVHPVALAVLLALPGYKQLPSIVGVPATIVLSTFMSWIFFLLVEQHFLSTPQRAAEPVLALSRAN